MDIMVVYDHFDDENEYAVECPTESWQLLKAGVQTIAEDPLREALLNLALNRRQ